MKKILAVFGLVFFVSTSMASEVPVQGPLHEASIEEWLRGKKSERLITAIHWVDSYLSAEGQSVSREDQLAVMAFGVVQCLDQTYLSDETLEILPKMASLVCVKSLVGK
ncbi:hypothetical protein [Curvivirga sp.]|uniref:hypothetical protein n=1 Tax=Curvivirga sp. TaxID=2856848 RepID=UPI003B5BC0DA